jgi:hypothetical protein
MNRIGERIRHEGKIPASNSVILSKDCARFSPSLTVMDILRRDLLLSAQDEEILKRGTPYSHVIHVSPV